MWNFNLEMLSNIENVWNQSMGNESQATALDFSLHMSVQDSSVDTGAIIYVIIEQCVVWGLM